MATGHAGVVDIRPLQLGQPREQLHHPSAVEKMSFSSCNCRFPRPCFVDAIIFPTQNGCQKSPIIVTLPL